MIKGFTRLQANFATQMWNMETQQQVDDFIRGLPKSLRPKAEVVRQMLLAEALDEECEDLEMAKQVIEMVR